MNCIAVILLLLLVISCEAADESKTDKSKPRNVLHVGMILSKTENFFGRRLISGLKVGMENLRASGILPGYEIEYRIKGTNCNGRNGVRATIEIWRDMGTIDAIIGDTCSVSCQPVALVAAAWNVPMVSNLCTSDALSDTKTYPTFTRVVGVYQTFAPIITAIVNSYNWKVVGILTDTADLFKDLAIATRNILINQGVIVHYYAIPASVRGDKTLVPSSLVALRATLKRLKNLVRVISIMRYGEDTRNTLALAYEEGMHNGEFVFIGLESSPFPPVENAYRPDIPTDVLWQGWITIQERFTMSDRFEEFRINSSIIAKTLPKDEDKRDPKPEDFRQYSALVYDALFTWALALNKTLEQGYEYNDGRQIAKNIYNMTFEGMTGTVVMDAVGDRMYDHEIWHYQNGLNIPVLMWSAKDGKMYKIYKSEDQNDWSGLIWAGNVTTVPRDTPLCGWKNEFCKSDKVAVTKTIGGVVTGGIFFAVIFGIGFAVRYFRKKSKLKVAAAYIVSWASMKVVSKGLGASFSGSKATIGSEKKIDVGHSIELAKCRNLLGVVKRVGSKSVSPTSDKLLNELRILKSVKHDNLNAVIAVCLEVPNACILTQFAQRGSFWDVIGSDDVTLTWDFKSSLIADVANGMAYLHSTEIGCHGHLTSSNCVIDNRWIGKVTDYGLSYMKEENRAGEQIALPANKRMWIAPEILRNAPTAGSKEGDVYSFAIIAQEMAFRDIPYFENQLTVEVEEIIQRVASGKNPPYRPLIREDEEVSAAWIKLIEMCWEENPSSRPTFQRVKNIIKDITKGKGTNLVQIIIKRLEEHTKNLEVIVDERTRDLFEEKAKMEILLRELIPPSVVKRLTMGKQVESESFESVSVFFSDIVSFTRISAAGTPHDVVKMLNLMYTMFDEVSIKFDVYKVATIGDAYFVASGVPIRNGIKHAAEICGMALQLLISVQHFPIPHIPTETLKLRIGVHSGGVVAGVAGVKMPRYQLFGDTVDIASKMESSGESMKIHISQITHDLLQRDGHFVMEERGITDVKGIENTMTYFLLSRTS